MSLMRVSGEDGSWGTLLTQWESECNDYSEDFGEYATASIPTLQPLAEQSQVKNAGVYALRDGERYLSACQLNVALLPGYDGKVLRVRHMVIAPSFDFSLDIGIEEYIKVLSDNFIGVVDISDAEMLAPHVKFHLRSPAEREFFSHFQKALRDHTAFSSVELIGSWLYLSK